MELADPATTDVQWSDEEKQQSGSGPSGKKQRITAKSPIGVPPRKLKTSERRRIQNRQAQKTYREKQKRRLQALESFAKTQTIIHHDGAAASTPMPAAVGQDMAGMLAVDSPIMGLPGLMQHQDFVPTPGIGSLVDCGPGLNAAALNCPTSGSAPIYRYVPNSSTYGMDVVNTSTTSKSFRDDLFSASTPMVNLSGPEAITPGSSFGSPHHMQQDLSKSQSNNNNNNNNSVLSNQATEGNDTDSLLAYFLLQDDVTLSKSLLQDIRRNKITLRDVLRVGLQSLDRDSRDAAGKVRVSESSLQQRAHLQLPDLHTNTIRVTQMSFVSAVLYNATMLGITAPEMFSHDTESHFYTIATRRASCATTEDAAAQHAALVDIKEDLKPTQNQLTLRHHPYIDTLPFRVFRERLIALINAQPPIINTAELCHDLQSDGVICWGSSAGAGTGHSGAPWDIRSWEVRPWFLKKWWMLTEGVDGEMYQQARWWCEMRGEDVPALWA